MAVRPSGTEPKVKSYIEVRRSCADGEVDAARAEARHMAEALADLAGRF